MKEDITLFLAIEKLMQDKMFFHGGLQVIKDIDIAEILEVDVKNLRLAVKKKRERFPADFMVELDDMGYAFAEAGVIILGGLLKSERARKVHLQFIEYFVHLSKKNGISIFDLLKNDIK